MAIKEAGTAWKKRVTGLNDDDDNNRLHACSLVGLVMKSTCDSNLICLYSEYLSVYNCRRVVNFQVYIIAVLGKQTVCALCGIWYYIWSHECLENRKCKLITRQKISHINCIIQFQYFQTRFFTFILYRESK